MFFKTYAVASLLAGVIGSPITDTTASFKLAKRSEGIHLVNCEEGSNYIYSAVVVSTHVVLAWTESVLIGLTINAQYCANDSDCDFNPASGNECIPNGGGVTVWEGFPESCEFSTGITFSWDIESNAKSQPYFSQVGYKLTI